MGYKYEFDLTSERQQGMNRYVLQRDMPGCKRGTIFVHDKEDTSVGSIADGCLKLAWDGGQCQKTAQYCGGTFILHASVKDDPEWFKEEKSIKEELKAKIIELIERL